MTMGFFDFLNPKKGGWRGALSRQKLTRKPKTRKKKTEKAVQEQKEEPLITVSRQLTLIQEGIASLDATIHSGFRGLRDDHHRILEEQLTKKEFDIFREKIESKRDLLQRLKGEIDEEIKVLDIDKKLLELLQKRSMRSVEIAEILKISRQYAATRTNALMHTGFVESVRNGKEIYYRLKKP